MEEAIEAEMEKEITCVDSAELGKASRIVDAAGRYIEFCKGTFPNELSLNGLKVVVDCANGATYHIGAECAARAWARPLSLLAVSQTASTLTKKWARPTCARCRRACWRRRRTSASRLTATATGSSWLTMKGNKVDGDQIMYIIAREGLRQGQLRGGAVGTLMSNMGLELALKQLGIPFARAKVGDRYVLEKIAGKKAGASARKTLVTLFCWIKTTTGDGIVAGLQVLAAMVRNHMSLHDLCSGI